MAWQRKIPFGYMIRDGLVQPNPEEAEAVRYIFSRYLAGAPLLAIAEGMTTHGPRYHQHTPAWNKNMVKRILENAKYTGADNWPRIVSDEDFTTVQRQREGRNTYAPLMAEIRLIQGKTVCGLCGARLIRGTRSHGRVSWRCQKPDCGQRVAVSDERLAQLVDGRLRELAREPQLLTVTEPQRGEVTMDAIRLQNELTQALNRGGERPEYIKFLILSTAAQRYGRIPDPTPVHDLEQLRTRLEQGAADADTMAELLSLAVRAIRLGPGKSAALELVGGTVIPEKKEASA